MMLMPYITNREIVDRDSSRNESTNDHDVRWLAITGKVGLTHKTGGAPIVYLALLFP